MDQAKAEVVPSTGKRVPLPSVDFGGMGMSSKHHSLSNPFMLGGSFPMFLDFRCPWFSFDFPKGPSTSEGW